MEVAESPALDRTEVDFGDDGDEFEGIDSTDAVDSLGETEAPESAESPIDSGPARDANGRFVKRDTMDPREALMEAQGAESTSEAPAPTKAPAEPDDLVQRAAEYGLSAEEAGRFDRDTLSHWMAMSDRTAAEWARKLREQDQPQEQVQQPQQFQQQYQQPPVNGYATNGHTTNGQAAQAPVNGQAQPSPWTDYQLQLLQPLAKPELKLDPEVFEEEAINTINALNDAWHERAVEDRKVLDAALRAIAHHHETINQFTGQSQAEQQAQLERDFDTWFDSLGPEWAGKFGSGPAADMPDNSPFLAERNKVISQMVDLQDARRLRGQSDLSRDVLRDRALGSLYHNEIQSRARKELASKVARRNSQAMPRPASSSGKPRTGDELARENVRKFLAEHDINDDDDGF